jgi:hypothetical protein
LPCRQQHFDKLALLVGIVKMSLDELPPRRGYSH